MLINRYKIINIGVIVMKLLIKVNKKNYYMNCR